MCIKKKRKERGREGKTEIGKERGRKEINGWIEISIEMDRDTASYRFCFLENPNEYTAITNAPTNFNG